MYLRTIFTIQLFLFLLGCSSPTKNKISYLDFDFTITNNVKNLLKELELEYSVFTGFNSPKTFVHPEVNRYRIQIDDEPFWFSKEGTVEEDFLNCRVNGVIFIHDNDSFELHSQLIHLSKKFNSKAQLFYSVKSTEVYIMEIYNDCKLVIYPENKYVKVGFYVDLTNEEVINFIEKG